MRGWLLYGAAPGSQGLNPLTLWQQQQVSRDRPHSTGVWAVTDGIALIRLGYDRDTMRINPHGECDTRRVGTHMKLISKNKTHKKKQQLFSAFSHSCRFYFFFLLQANACCKLSAVICNASLVCSLFTDHIQSRPQPCLACGLPSDFGVVLFFSSSPFFVSPGSSRLFWFSFSLESRIKLIALLLGAA